MSQTKAVPVLKLTQCPGVGHSTVWCYYIAVLQPFDWFNCIPGSCHSGATGCFLNCDMVIWRLMNSHYSVMITLHMWIFGEMKNKFCSYSIISRSLLQMKCFLGQNSLELGNFLYQNWQCEIITVLYPGTQKIYLLRVRFQSHSRCYFIIIVVFVRQVS